MKSLTKILSRLLLLCLFLGILVLIVALARGYRFNLNDKTITSTGILAISSAPNAAKIYVNNELKGVTNTNITVPPGTYNIRISKEGFTDWSNTVTLKGEVVYSHEAVLFPKNPSLSPLTNFGVMKAIPVGQADKVLAFNINGDPEKDGIYLLEGNTRRLTLLSPLKPVILLSSLPQGIDPEKTDVVFSADYSQGIFTFVNPAEKKTYSYLLPIESTTTEPLDITNSKNTILAAWKKEKSNTLRKLMETFPDPIEKVATDSFKIISFSPDETKVLYQAKKSVTLPVIIKPPLIGTNQTPEQRTLQPENVYVYDAKEDKNFLIPVDNTKFMIPSPTPSPTPEEEVQPLAEVTPATNEPMFETDNYYSVAVQNYIQWYPSSRHLVLNEGKNFTIMEYDGINKQSVYSGPYNENFYTLNSNWKLLILANLNPQNNKYGDIYEVGIR